MPLFHPRHVGRDDRGGAEQFPRAENGGEVTIDGAAVATNAADAVMVQSSGPLL
jgi:hypothetical protein